MPAPTTHWTVVYLLQARSASKPESEKEFYDWFDRYRSWVINVIRHKGFQWETAKDIAQDVLQEVWAKRVLFQANRGRGRMRNFLLSIIRGQITGYVRREIAKKRGAGKVSLIAEPDLHVAPKAVTTAYEDEEWVVTVRRNAMVALRAENEELYRIFQLHIDAGKKIEEVARELGLSKERSKKGFERAWERLKRLTYEEVTKYTDENDLEDEWDWFQGVLSRL